MAPSSGLSRASSLSTFTLSALRWAVLPASPPPYRCPSEERRQWPPRPPPSRALSPAALPLGLHPSFGSFFSKNDIIYLLKMFFLPHAPKKFLVNKPPPLPYRRLTPPSSRPPWGGAVGPSQARGTNSWRRKGTDGGRAQAGPELAEGPRDPAPSEPRGGRAQPNPRQMLGPAPHSRAALFTSGGGRQAWAHALLLTRRLRPPGTGCRVTGTRCPGQRSPRGLCPRGSSWVVPGHALPMPGTQRSPTPRGLAFSSALLCAVPR